MLCCCWMIETTMTRCVVIVAIKTQNLPPTYAHSCTSAMAHHTVASPLPLPRCVAARAAGHRLPGNPGGGRRRVQWCKRRPKRRPEVGGCKSPSELWRYLGDCVEAMANMTHQCPTTSPLVPYDEVPSAAQEAETLTAAAAAAEAANTPYVGTIVSGL